MDYNPKSESPYSWWLTYEDLEELPLVSLAIKMFSITPSEAGCERNFSILKWFYGDRRTSLDINRIELMSMIRSFWMTNIKREMAFYGKEITVDDLRHCTQILTIINELEVNNRSEDFESSDQVQGSISLDISSLVNLDHTIFGDETGNQMIQTNLNTDVTPDNIEYSVDDLVARFLNEEDSNNNIST